MRACIAIAVLIGAAGIGSAGAADYGAGYATGGVRAPQMVVYDNQPGVYVRAYWTQPWQGRHYYPFTGKKPKVGRHERLSDVRPAPPPRPMRAIEQLPDEQTLGPLK